MELFVLRQKRPEAERPYKAFGYPIVPALYVVSAAVILVVLFIYQTAQTWPGLVIVLTGIPVYFIWRRVGKPMHDVQQGRRPRTEPSQPSYAIDANTEYLRRPLTQLLTY